MGVNKLIIGNEVKFNISDSTVTPATLLKRVIAYNSSGERIVGEATGGSNMTLDDYLSDPVNTDINHSTGAITSTMTDGTVTTKIATSGSTRTITSQIVPKSGSVNYTRTTKITQSGNVTKIRETLTKTNK